MVYVTNLTWSSDLLLICFYPPFLLLSFIFYYCDYFGLIDNSISYNYRSRGSVLLFTRV